MGIRVHKVIGYGVKNLKHEGHTMTDPRVDWDKLFHPKLSERRWDRDMNSFLRWLKGKKAQKRLLELHLREHPGIDDSMRKYREESDVRFFIGHLKTIRKSNPRAWLRQPSDCLVHRTEYGLPNVMVILSPDCPNWYRYDDIIDYYEETDQNGARRYSKPIARGGIYPYDHQMIRFRKPSKGIFNPDAKITEQSGIKKDKHGPVSMPVGAYNQLIGRWSPDMKPIAQGKFLSHLKRSWRPAVPLGVIAILLWHDCFPDLEKLIDDLRPMKYVWWS